MGAVSGLIGAQILLVEDNATLRNVIVSALMRDEHHVTAVNDGLAATEKLATGRYEIVLLDIGLPFVNGWQILEGLPPGPQPSVIVVSASGEEQAKVRALDLGADDYLTKPFGSDELRARVRAVLRRVRARADVGRTITCQNVTIDFANRAVARAGVEVPLSPTEYLLLVELAKNAGRAMDHSVLLSHVWGASYVGDRGYLRVFIKRLRGKLEEDPANPTIIVTVGRRGYRFGAMPS
jgi:two-component system KDP operon response regulator KdpE